MIRSAAHKSGSAAQIVNTFAGVDLKVGDELRDRHDNYWRVLRVDGQRLFPVEVGAWVNGSYAVKCLQADGRYDVNEDGPCDMRRV